MNKVFDNKEEVIADYMKEYNILEDKVDYYYHNQDKKKLFFVRMLNIKGTDTLKIYRVTRAGKFHLYLD
ncbi:hypothetical protein [Clostridium beijerinckii]|uniref:hypothetical protein n=1 Tax=Clostridium beijerinckii TaxID=1520 RepID=UPI00156D4A1A|nr:hypothetical protein [Clostridium beijerinckii]NRU52463.1 hypothetical protein [Clostridium beijerinckii]NYC69092.1 hypothetical protein [Clostridium beijerinckii]